VHWREGGIAFYAVSDVAPAQPWEFSRLVAAAEAYPPQDYPGAGALTLLALCPAESTRGDSGRPPAKSTFRYQRPASRSVSVSGTG
jgi:hypothetical protein